eukprot:Pgem_evm1s2378
MESAKMHLGHSSEQTHLNDTFFQIIKFQNKPIRKIHAKNNKKNLNKSPTHIL